MTASSSTPRAAATPAPSQPATAATQGPPASSTRLVPYLGGWSIRVTTELLPVGLPQDAPAGDAAGSGSLSGVAAGPLGVVATGIDAISAASWISTDGGDTWAERPVPSYFDHIAAHSGVFVASSGEGFWHSLDGVAWSRSATGPMSSWITRLAAGLGGFVAIAITPSGIVQAWSSPDGQTWRAAPDQASLHHFCPSDLAASASQAVAVGHVCGHPDRARILTSSDGRTWRQVSPPAGLSGTEASVSYTGGRFLLISPVGAWPHDGTSVWSSTTGLGWTQSSYVSRLGSSADAVGNVVRFGPGWVAVGVGSAKAGDCQLRVWQSPDLVHWSRLPLADVPYSTGSCTPVVATVAQGRLVVGRGRGLGPEPPLAWVGELVR